MLRRLDKGFLISDANSVEFFYVAAKFCVAVISFVRMTKMNHPVMWVVTAEQLILTAAQTHSLSFSLAQIRMQPLAP